MWTVSTKMEILKSHTGVLAGLVVETLVDLYDHLHALRLTKKTDLKKDQEYLSRRIEKEGITFLTTVLPRLDEFLINRFVKEDSDFPCPPGFAPYCDNGFPIFLRPLWLLLSTREEEWSPQLARIVRIARTLLTGLKKLEVPFTENQKAEKLSAFLEIEEGMDLTIYPQSYSWRAQHLIETLFARFEFQLSRPKHGPGAVAGGEKGVQKWEFSHYWKTLHARFPLYDFMWSLRSRPFVPGERRTYRLQLASHAPDYRKIVWTDSPVARLLFVPKDSRGPRIISCEPKELMYLQQAACSEMVRHIEAHPYTRGRVNFTDQSINGQLALASSRSRANATIDLSDASDRVSLALVQFLFPGEMFRDLRALRSYSTQLPDGSILPLNKYAPMGSALCFPVESVVFWALCVARIWEDTGDITYAVDSTYVYGDDIIVPNEHMAAVMETLELHGLKVNADKSLGGAHFFRESCGVDALNGHLITPLRIKKLPPRRSCDANSISAWVAYASNSVTPKRNSYIEAHVTRVFRALPHSRENQAFLCYFDDTDSDCLKRDVTWDPHIQQLVANRFVALTKSRSDKLDGYDGIHHALIMGRGESHSRVVTDPVTLIARRRVVVR